MNKQRTALMALALGMSALASSVAHADTPLTGAQVQVDPDFAWVLLLSPGELPEPSVRVNRGEVRAWFRGVDHERLTQAGDGLAFRDVRVRAGAGESTLVHIRLGDRREISLDDIAVVPFDGGSAIRFRRGALPQLPEAIAGETAEIEDIDADADLAADFDAEIMEEDAIEADTEESAEEAPLLATETEGALAAGILDEPEEQRGGSPVGLLLLVTALLGLVLLVVRVVASRRKAILPPPDIDVVSTKRIGPRHQLIVVRALGEEHLLSVNGTQTQLITTVNAGGDIPEDMLRLPPPKGPGASVPSTPPSAPLDSRPPVAFMTAPPKSPSSDERFGARLLDLATRRTDVAATPKSPVSAVAGLLELRRRLG